MSTPGQIGVPAVAKMKDGYTVLTGQKVPGSFNSQAIIGLDKAGARRELIKAWKKTTVTGRRPSDMADWKAKVKRYASGDPDYKFSPEALVEED
ncbi:MAG TPA: hypothetical protein PK406_00530 [Verrucomicrobiota bacterium]|nr:hypothetical protein [Verrucomicrobiota bacterium]